MALTPRVKNILLQPGLEWQVIESEQTTVGELYSSYIMLLAAIGPLASVVGLSLIGINLPSSGTYRVPLGSAIGHAAMSYVLGLAGVYVLALVIDALAPAFQGAKSHIQAMKVAAYSSTAAWLAAIFIAIPVLGFLQIAGLYSLYLLYLGLPPLMKAPRDKALLYAVVVILAAMVVLTIIGAVAGLIISFPAPTITP